MEWIEILWESMALQIALALFGAIGTIWGFYSHGVSNRKQCFAAKYSSYEIIKQGKNTIQNLELTFSGKEIHDLTITKFAIWNCGNKVIHGSDIVPTQKLRVVADESTEILEAQIITESDGSNCFQINDKANSEVILDFDYVDSREGIVLQILHTGSIDSLKVDGKIKGGKPIKQIGPDGKKKKRSPLIRKYMKKITAIMLVFEVILMAILTGAITFVEMGLISKEEAFSTRFWFGVPSENPVVVTALLWIMVGFMMIMAFKILRDAFMIGVPAKLKSFGNSDDL